MSYLDSKRGPRLLLQALLFCLLVSAPYARAQQPQQTPQDDVVRVNTELVRTDVTVTDKSGKFVEGLGREQFQVLVDGKPVPVAFFESVTGGAATAGPARGSGAGAGASGGAISRGRYVAFFMDDVHLSAPSLERVRKTVSQVIERGMGPDDRVMIATATGQLGFLQQFVDNKGVLRLALTRLTYKPYIVRDTEQVAMTEYQALRIDAGDKDALDHYVNEIMRQNNVQVAGGVGPPKNTSIGSDPSPRGQTAGLTRDSAERIVRERAQVMLKQTSAYSNATLAALESLLRGAAQMPGRKLVFFISDGFYLDDKNTDFSDRLKGIADAALRAGVVVYTIDARGLTGGDSSDALSNRTDPNGRLSRANVGDLAYSQAPLTSLASDTGGQASINTYGFDEAVARALAETSNYYRIAWKPELDEQKGAKFKRVEVSVIGRPDLNVRLPRGYMSALAASQPKPDAKPEQKASNTSKPSEAKSPEAKAIEEDFRAAFGSAAPLRALPIVLSTSFVDVPGTGGVLTSSVEVSTDALDYGAEGKQPAAVDVGGAIWNDQGKTAGGFKTRLNVTPIQSASPGGEQPGVIYNAHTPLAPGFYLVKVAARDSRGRQMGTASQWVEIPDLSKKQLALSSLHLGGRAVGGEKAGAAPQIQFSVDRRFSRSTKLDFLAFIYNAARATGGAAVDLSALVRVTREGRAVVSAPPIKIAPPAQTDLARIPFTGVISLGQLPPGRYELELEVNDNSAKTSAAQRVAFDIE